MTIGVTGRLLSAFFVAHDAVGGRVAADHDVVISSAVSRRTSRKERTFLLLSNLRNSIRRFRALHIAVAHRVTIVPVSAVHRAMRKRTH